MDNPDPWNELMILLIKERISKILLVLTVYAAVCLSGFGEGWKLAIVKGKDIRCGIDRTSGLPALLESHTDQSRRIWLSEPARLALRNEVSEVTAYPVDARVSAKGKGEVTATARFEPLQLSVNHQWSGTPSGLVWNLTFKGTAKRTGHEVTIDLPVLSRGVRIFTPSNDGIMDVAAVPTYRPVPYAHMGWESGQAYVLPLVTVMDPRTDQALTVALPPDQNIPHLQVEWIAGKTLRLTLAHRAMGGGEPSILRLILYSHAADYRATLKAYSDDFPAYFKPVIRRPQDEGAFWYHHIQDHPDFEEMARQNVRYLWASFWFTHLGEYLPAETEWFPYTYAKWWKLSQTMSDEKINAFIREMRGHGISVFAYFNVTEYGGAGDKGGDASVSDRLLREKFADALMKDEENRPIPTWEGAYAMNPRSRYSLWPKLEEQVRRHLARLPDFAGFIIDRLDWASRYDYGHSDDFTMVGDRAVENMAGPVAEAVESVCRMTHQAGKRVFVNQFYRIEMLRDVDGYCHENDYLPALGYLSPYRPAAAWHMRKSYDGDLLEFERQMKLRLQFALMPQMIAREFPISQQKPNARAAEMLERYAPLFRTLAGKEQVLLPHCVEATGDNDVNLFVNGAGHYVVPLTSRTRFRSRGAIGSEVAQVTLRVPDAAELRWAHAISADGASYRGTLIYGAKGMAIARVEKHGTATMIVMGRDNEPGLEAAW
jgi:hypothetical protein